MIGMVMESFLYFGVQSKSTHLFMVDLYNYTYFFLFEYKSIKFFITMSFFFFFSFCTNISPQTSSSTRLFIRVYVILYSIHQAIIGINLWRVFPRYWVGIFNLGFHESHERLRTIRLTC